MSVPISRMTLRIEFPSASSRRIVFRFSPRITLAIAESLSFAALATIRLSGRNWAKAWFLFAPRLRRQS